MIYMNALIRSDLTVGDDNDENDADWWLLVREWWGHRDHDDNHIARYIGDDNDKV